MRTSLAILPRARPDPDPDPGHISPQLLTELLALNEEMVEQLCLERLTVVGTADILTGLIDQHEHTARLIRAQLADDRCAMVSQGIA